MISYEEYKKDYFNGRSLAKALKNEMTEERFLLYYFMDCFAEDSDEVNENLYKEKERLVDLAIVLAENQSKNNNISVIYDEFYFVLSLLERIDYNASELDRMEVACHENIQDILSSLKQKKFEEYFYENLNNLNLFVKHTENLIISWIDWNLTIRAIYFIKIIKMLFILAWIILIALLIGFYYINQYITEGLRSTNILITTFTLHCCKCQFKNARR